MKSTVLELFTGTTSHVNLFNHSNFDDYVFVEPDHDNDLGNSRKFPNSDREDDYDHCNDATQIFLTPYKNITDTSTGGNQDDAEMSTVVSVDNEEILLHDSYSMISCDFVEDLDDEQELMSSMTVNPITAIEEIAQDPKPTSSKNLNCTKNDEKAVERRTNSGSRLSNKKRRSKRMKEMKRRAALAAASESLAAHWVLQKPQTATNPLCGNLSVTGSVCV